MTHPPLFTCNLSYYSAAEDLLSSPGTNRLKTCQIFRKDHKKSSLTKEVSISIEGQNTCTCSPDSNNGHKRSSSSKKKALKNSESLPCAVTWDGSKSITNTVICVDDNSTANNMNARPRTALLNVTLERSQSQNERANQRLRSHQMRSRDSSRHGRIIRLEQKATKVC